MKTTLATLVLCLLVFMPFAQAKEGPDFSKVKIKVGKVELTVEVADTPAKQAHGLMFRKELAEGTGMIFVFPDEQPRSFWMKNTFVELSIGFFDRKKKLIDIQDMAPSASELVVRPPTYNSKGPAQYALEVPKGWFKKHSIQEGAILSGL